MNSAAEALTQLLNNVFSPSAPRLSPPTDQQTLAARAWLEAAFHKAIKKAMMSPPNRRAVSQPLNLAEQLARKQFEKWRDGPPQWPGGRGMGYDQLKHRSFLRGILVGLVVEEVRRLREGSSSRLDFLAQRLAVDRVDAVFFLWFAETDPPLPDSKRRKVAEWLRDNVLAGMYTAAATHRPPE